MYSVIMNFPVEEYGLTRPNPYLPGLTMLNLPMALAFGDRWAPPEQFYPCIEEINLFDAFDRDFLRPHGLTLDASPEAFFQATGLTREACDQAAARYPGYRAMLRTDLRHAICGSLYMSEELVMADSFSTDALLAGTWFRAIPVCVDPALGAGLIARRYRGFYLSDATPDYSPANLVRGWWAVDALEGAEVMYIGGEYDGLDFDSDRERFGWFRPLARPERNKAE